jgi:hypothetical protein
MCHDRYIPRYARRNHLPPAAIAFIAGIGMVIGANRIFRRIGTNARPSQPTLALATTGVFSWTRNPMYVGGRRQPHAPRHRDRFRPRLGPAAPGSKPALSCITASSYVRSAIWNASSATNTGATRRRSHDTGGDSEGPLAFSQAMGRANGSLLQSPRHWGG